MSVQFDKSFINRDEMIEYVGKKFPLSNIVPSGLRIEFYDNTDTSLLVGYWDNIDKSGVVYKKIDLKVKSIQTNRRATLIQQLDKIRVIATQ